MEALIEYLGAAQYEIHARQHRIFCDQPVEHGGFDEGMTPPELLLGSLGSCAAYYAVEYLKSRKISAEGLSVKVSAEKAANPGRLGSFHIAIDVPGGLDATHREGILRAARKCLIHNTLTHPPEVTMEIEGAAGHPALAA